MKIKKFNSKSKLNETLSSGVLYRDINTELLNLLNMVENKYNVSKDEASQAIIQYFSTQHWKNDQE